MVGFVTDPTLRRDDPNDSRLSTETCLSTETGSPGRLEYETFEYEVSMSSPSLKRYDLASTGLEYSSYLDSRRYARIA